MTDEGEGREPDGWGVLHENKTMAPGLNHYMFGPLPSQELADLIKVSTKCDCTIRVVPLFFPVGIVMAMAVPEEPEEEPPARVN